uniref:RHS repeat-associated core domain-containing protein n=1 Tax=Longirhabdus pacifica TaxID=2305227 RepID=UPI0013E8E927
YLYNGDGLLTERTEDGETTRYYYDGQVIIAEATIVNDNPELKARYIRGKKLEAIQYEDNTKAYVLYNGHGDVVELRDEQGNVLNEYSYDIWGNPIVEKETVHNPFRYSGELWDSTTELQYLRARWYDPSVGRFINEDSYEGTLTSPLTHNLYTYVENNPLKYIDPNGHKPMYFYDYDESLDQHYYYYRSSVEGLDAINTIYGYFPFGSALNFGIKELHEWARDYESDELDLNMHEHGEFLQGTEFATILDTVGTFTKSKILNVFTTFLGSTLTTMTLIEDWVNEDQMDDLVQDLLPEDLMKTYTLENLETKYLLASGYIQALTDEGILEYSYSTGGNLTHNLDEETHLQLIIDLNVLFADLGLDN